MNLDPKIRFSQGPIKGSRRFPDCVRFYDIVLFIQSESLMFEPSMTLNDIVPLSEPDTDFGVDAPPRK